MPLISEYQLFPTVLPNSLTRSSRVFMESIGFSMYTITSSANNDSFVSSFPIWLPFISFSCLIAVAMTSNTLLNRSGKSGHLVLFLILAGFQFLPIEYDVGCRSLIYSPYYVEECSLYSHFAECIYQKWVLYLIKCFFRIY